jgi:hypothetical protein
MKDFPDIALSVRQPWTWGIIHAGKPVENRDWRRPNPGLKFRGRVAVHASKGMTRDEYLQAASFMHTIGVVCPPARDLLRGGIIGSVEVVDVVSQYPSPWFFGPRALVLRDPRPCNFIPCAGALGFFKWQAIEAGNPAAPARWMLPKPAAAAAPVGPRQEVLL